MCFFQTPEECRQPVAAQSGVREQLQAERISLALRVAAPASTRLMDIVGRVRWIFDLGAETGAIAAMIAAGGQRIVTIAVAGGGSDRTGACTPCGGCRQRIREFAVDDNVLHGALVAAEQDAAGGRAGAIAAAGGGCLIAGHLTGASRTPKHRLSDTHKAGASGRERV